MELLSAREASTYLRISIYTLNRWRSIKMGPPYIKMGRYIKYSKESLDQFLKSHEVDPGGRK
ncbi:helix-turn-helix domain-containing protein [Thermodesulfobacteriota bacterium]